LEATLGLRLPSTFVEFCKRWNGGFPDKSNNFYIVPQSYNEFYDEYRQSKGIIADKLFGATEKLPRFSLLNECRNVLGEVAKYVLPISADLFGNHTVVRVDSPNGMVYWCDHELWEMGESSAPGPKFAERPRLFPIAPDLETFYNALTVDPYKK